MIALRLVQAATAINAVVEGVDVAFHGVSTDTRMLHRGELFVALKGERFDGHDCIDEAHDKGAAGAVVGHPVATGLALLKVADTRRALGLLAKAWRAHFTLPVVAVTGSNGKTTVKEMVAAILGEAGSVLSTAGNLNNDIGVPKTLFRLAGEHRFAVIEMGANHPGEIAWLAELAQPTVAVVTTCAPAHLEGFGTIEGVARAKGEIYGALGPRDTAVINADDRFAPLWRDSVKDRASIMFGDDPQADVRASDVHLGGAGKGTRFVLELPHARTTIELPLDGMHNVRNALAAAACALALKVPDAAIKSGLERVAPVTGRLQVRRGLHGLTIIDDTYNANPGSLDAALAVLRQSDGCRWLVLGDMGELGAGGFERHGEAGRAARAAGVQRLYALGDLARAAVDGFGEGARHYTSRNDLIADLRAGADASVTLLVKGSRAMRLEQIVAALAEGATSPC